MLPGFDEVFFNVVFGSEEYPEYVGSQFIDGFGLYVNGVNIAEVDGMPVNINHPYMVDEPGTELDGILDNSTSAFGQFVHTFRANVNQTGNELIFIVADTSDDILDTTVYISQLGGSAPITADYSLELFEDGSPSDGVINLGEDITATATTTDSTVDSITIRWIDPMNTVVREQTFLGTSAADTFAPNVVGTWTVEAEFSDGTVIVKTLNVSFNVLPETAIGAIGVIGASIAVFAAFLYRKRIL